MINETVLASPDFFQAFTYGFYRNVFKEFMEQIAPIFTPIKPTLEIVGETGGKRFYTCHKTANTKQSLRLLFRGAF